MVPGSLLFGLVVMASCGFTARGFTARVRHGASLPRVITRSRPPPSFGRLVESDGSAGLELHCTAKDGGAGDVLDSSNPSSSKITVKYLLEMGTNLFPLWVLSFSLLGFIRPNLFLWFAPLVTAALTLTMICMGMTLTVSDFKNVASSWRLVLLGFVAQYTIMPFSAAALSRVMGLSPELASGLILVGCAPGGTASNLVTMIAKADLALSILMTAASTVAAVVMTPLLVTRLAGEYVSIKANDLVLSTLSVVLLPVAVGLGLNTNFPVFCSRSAQYTPFLSVLLVALICGSISASNSGIVKGVLSAKLLAAIVALHSIGFLVGYLFARVGGANESQSRTISIETGMQNSALAVVLAKHFPNPQLCALPGSLSATIHSIIGSLLAALWRWRSAKAAANKQTASS